MEDPLFAFEVEGMRVEGRPDNTALVTHMAGKVAIDGVDYDMSRFDRVVIEIDDDRHVMMLREQFQEDNFNQIVDYMLSHDYEALINRRNVDPAERKMLVDFIGANVASELSTFDTEIDGLLDGDSNHD